MIVGAALVAVGVAALLLAEATDRPWVPPIAKPLASAGFLLAAVGAPAVRLPAGRGWLLLGALILAAAGDILLVPSNRRAFLAGMAAFSLAHLSLAVWFVMGRLDLLVLVIAIAVLLVVGHLVWTWLSPYVTSALRVPVRIYILLVSLMAAGAIAFGVERLASAQPTALLPALGGVLFFLSDISVARQRFVHASIANRAWGLPMYYSAQLLIASAVLAS